LSGMLGCGRMARITGRVVDVMNLPGEACIRWPRAMRPRLRQSIVCKNYLYAKSIA